MLTLIEFLVHNRHWRIPSAENTLKEFLVQILNEFLTQNKLQINSERIYSAEQTLEQTFKEFLLQGER